MLKRLMLLLLLVVAVAAGCAKKCDVKVEEHEEINREDTVQQKMVVE